jgi:radical SAM protein with 4Fe4S-binding SPASM domain
VQINTTFTAFNQGDMEALVKLSRELDCPIRTTAYTFPPVRNGHEICSGCLSPEEQGRLNAAFEVLSSTPAGRAAKRKLLQSVADAAEADQPTPAGKGNAEPHRMGCMAGRGSFWMTWDGCMLPCGMLGDHGAARGNFGEQWAEVRRLTEDVCLPMTCKGCAYKRLCPSCAAVCYAKNGSTEAIVPEMCRYVKTYVETYLQRVAAEPTISDQTADQGEMNDPFLCH